MARDRFTEQYHANKDAAKAKKDLLRSKFVSHTQKSKPEEPADQEDAAVKQLERRHRKELDKRDKEIAKLRKELSDEQKQRRSLERDLKISKAANFELVQKANDIHSDFLRYQEQEKERMQAMPISPETAALLRANEQQIFMLQEEVAGYKQKQLKQIQKEDGEERESTRLRKKLKEANRKYDEGIKRYAELREEYKALHEKIQGMETLKPESLLLHLKEDLRVANLFQYKLLPSLWNRYVRLQGFRVQRANTKKQETVIRQYPGKAQPLEVYGYVVQANNGWQFCSLDDRIYEIGENDRLLEKEADGKPALAFIDAETNQVFRISLLPTHTQRKLKGAMISTRRISDEQSEEEETYIQLPDISVLIVGSRNLAKYKARLAKHGMKQVTTYDAYENSMLYLPEAMKSHDLVLVCTSHVPHAVMDLVKKDPSKVEVMQADNEESIVARIRYVTIQLGGAS